jgi:protein-tyrosine kinase
MNIIEQANKRLEELKRSGVDVQSFAPRLAPTGQTQLPEQRKSPAPAGARAGVESGEPRLGQASAEHEPVNRFAADQGGASAEVSIDLERLARMGYLVADQSRSELASQFRHIKRPLLRNVDRESRDEGNRSSLIMMTSAIAGEGKTFCSINLAMSIAMEVDTSVLLVDADVVRPAVLDRLGLPPRPGLLDLLTGEVDHVSDVMLKTNVPKLSILPAGAPRNMATELLASAAMDALLLDLATRYPDRVVILDAPPLLLTTESPVLASRAGQVVIVVDSSKTHTQKVAQAFATVESCPVVLSLLNKYRSPVKSDGYGYSYQ